jgi:hypothetical protein
LLLETGHVTVKFGGAAKVARGFELDWVLIRTHTIKKILGVAAVAVVAAGLVFFGYSRLERSPEARARIAIERADAAYQVAAAQPLPPQWRSELLQAAEQLNHARSAYSEAAWENAEGLAESARSRFAALAGAGSQELVGAGQFFSVEGRVQLQRAGQTEWEAAHQRMAVFNGDFVRTARDGSAEVLFADGSLYRIAPNSLLEIHRQQSQQSPGSVKMVVGRINVYTSGTTSTVTTDSVSTEIESDSRVALGVDSEDRGTTVAAYQGGAHLRNPQGAELRVGEREQVAAAADGTFSEKLSIPEPPTPIQPRNNAGFDISLRPTIELSWRGRPPSGRVHLQVGRSKRFVAEQLDVDVSELAKDVARLQAVAPGTYFWRLAAVAGDGVESEWSQVRRFRVFSSQPGQVFDDQTPPELEINPPQQLGQMFIVEGFTEVGATVTINDEEVELDSDGHFRKAIEIYEDGWTDLVVVAVDPSGNRTERRERVFVEVY